MHFLYGFHVVLWNRKAMRWLFQEESIVHVSSWMTLWLEKGVKVPERRLSVPACWHFCESHLQEDFSELLSNKHEWMQMTTCSRKTLCLKVILLELLIFPSASSEHFCRKFCFEFGSLGGELWSLGDFVALDRLDVQMFSLFILI